MEALLMALAVIGGAAGLVYVANGLNEARARVNLLRSQRRQQGNRRR